MKTRMIFMFLLFWTGIVYTMQPCTWYEADFEYCNVFSQELIKDPRYASFLLSYDNAFYRSQHPQWVARNANIEEWQAYLGLDYEKTYYLVIKSGRKDIQALVKGGKAGDEQLSFVTPDFVKRHKQALLYLAYAKYLEPYMLITKESEWYYEPEESGLKEVSELDYTKAVNVLSRSWNAEKDVELKLRYGYQLVRLAHYNRQYQEAVSFFDTYVEPLDYRPEMYYYALSQKAGALYGLGNVQQASADFVKVFSYANDLKETSYASLFLIHNNERLGNESKEPLNTAELLSTLRTDEERRSLLFMLAFKNFNNPLNGLEEIAAEAPDAIEAKVLMVRAINSIEREVLFNTYSYLLQGTDKRYPIVTDKHSKDFLNASFTLSAKITRTAHEKDFWNLTTAYLAFLRKDFVQARQYMEQITASDPTYVRQKEIIEAHLYLAELSKITPEAERVISAKYGDKLDRTNRNNQTFLHILANRYFLQGDYAKAFLVHNTLSDMEHYLQKELLDNLKTFYNKKNKNETENWLSESLNDHSFNMLYGTHYLTKGNFAAAYACFKTEQPRITVSERIFGNNIRVWYSGLETEIMRDDYLAEFPFIKKQMQEKEVTEALLQLQKIAKEKSDLAAKANYLIGNFFYNVSTTGYFRHYLRFGMNNRFHSEMFCCYDEEETYDGYANNSDGLFFVYIPASFHNTTDVAGIYLEAALRQATDDELKARILFALAKNELERSYKKEYSLEKILLPEKTRAYFNTLAQYKETAFYRDAITKCLYFDAYVNR